MYKIEKKLYGFRLTFEGFIEEKEMKSWFNESVKELSHTTGEFGVFVDMRSLKPLPAESQSFMQLGQKLFKEKGMKRSVVILNDPTTKIQFKRIAKESGIYEWERYIDVSSDPNWEILGQDWISSGIDPDKKSIEMKLAI